jgi:hypothetical protein
VRAAAPDSRALRALVGVAVAVFFLGASCGSPRQSRLELGELLVRRVSEREAAVRVGGVVAQAGDWVLEGPSLRVVVGGLGREGEARGAILEAKAGGASEDESIVLLSPRLHSGRRRFTVRAEEMAALERSGRPVLRIDGVAEVGGRTVDVARELTIGRSGREVSMTTRIAPRGDRSLTVRAGARIGWGGGTPWMPGSGWIDDATWHDGTFVAGEGRDVGTVFGVHDGPVRVLGEYERHGQASFLLHSEVIGPERTASEAAPAYERTTLAIAPRGIAEAVRRFGWARGAPFPEERFLLPNAPAGAEIRVVTEDGQRPVMRARPDALGAALVPLPQVDPRPDAPLLAIATAPGHAESEPHRFSARGEHGVHSLVIPRGGRIRITARDAAGGAKLPARARIVGARGTPSPQLGPDWSADGAGDAVLLPAGEAIVPVPPGAYRVVVTHGPEWTVYEELVEVSETYRPDVRATLTRAVDAGEWVPCELHLHASPSPDSEVPLDDRVLSLVAEGIRFVAPTDHNIVTTYEPAIAELALPPGLLTTVSGLEATTDSPIYGHFNAFPVPFVENAPGNGAVPFEGTMPATLFASLRALGPGVLVQVNHPRLEGGIGYFDRMGYDATTGLALGPYSADFDLLEIWNGYDLARPEQMLRVFADWLAMLGRYRRVVATGNSDSHQIRYVWAGYPRTYVRTSGGASDPSTVLASLRAGHAFVTSGPFLEVSVGEAGPGDVAAITNGVARVHVVVRAPPWMDASIVEVWSGGAIVRSERFRDAPTPPVPPDRAPRRRAPAAVVEPPPLPVLRYTADLDVEIAQDGYLVVLVRGDRPMDEYFGRAGIPPLAFTNPIWLDADGNGVLADPGDAAPNPGTFEAVEAAIAADAGGELADAAAESGDAGLPSDDAAIPPAADAAAGDDASASSDACVGLLCSGPR